MEDARLRLRMKQFMARQEAEVWTHFPPACAVQSHFLKDRVLYFMEMLLRETAILTSEFDR